jgi:hypothetical protein
MSSYADYDVEPEADLAAGDLPNFRVHVHDFDGCVPRLAYRPTDADGTFRRRRYGDEGAEETSYATVPEAVKSFVLTFNQCLHDQNVYDVQSMYEISFNKLTDKYFKTVPWPSASSIAGLVDNGALRQRRRRRLPPTDAKSGFLTNVACLQIRSSWCCTRRCITDIFILS